MTSSALQEPLPLWIRGEAVETSVLVDVHDPGRIEDRVGQVAAAAEDHVEAAVAAAERGGAEWAAIPLDQRLSILRFALDEATPLIPELAIVLARENGGLLREATLDLERGVGVLRSVLDYAEQYLPERRVDGDGYDIRLLKRPVGVVALIVPWNSPIVLTMSKLGPALAAGNGVIVKPSSDAPLALTLLLSRLSAALPPGALNVLNGRGGLGARLTGHDRIRKISFTGSTEVGRDIMRAASSNIKRISLELGGNDPAILLEDVQVSEIVDDLCRGIFTRAGQICFAVKRIYAPASRIAEITDAIVEVVDGYAVGHGLDERSSFGPIISARQRTQLDELLARTRAAGAEVRTLGSPVDPSQFAGGHYMLPVVVTGIPHESDLVATEQFGPIIPIVPYSDVDEAVRLANDSEFGLASSVWGSDLDDAQRVAERIDAGSTFVNSHNLWSLSFDMPFGGTKQSGIGRERTALGLQEYVEDHAIRVPS